MLGLDHRPPQLQHLLIRLELVKRFARFRRQLQHRIRHLQLGALQLPAGDALSQRQKEHVEKISSDRQLYVRPARTIRPPYDPVEHRVFQQPRLHQGRLRDPQLLIARRQARIVQQRDLHRVVAAQLAPEHRFDLRLGGTIVA